MERIHNKYICLKYYILNLDMDEIADKFAEYSDVFAYRDGMKMIVLLYKSKGFDIKKESYIENSFKINTCIPEVFGIKKEEVKDKILFAMEKVKKESVLIKGIFKEINDSLTNVEKIKTMEKKIKALEKELKKKTQHITNIIISEVCISESQ